MEPYYMFRQEGLYCHYLRDEDPDPADFRMHTHENYEIYLFLTGKGKFRIEGSVYPLSPGDILLMRPAEAHYFEADPGEPYERFALNFSASYLSALDPAGALLLPFDARPAGWGNRYRPEDFPDGTAARLAAALTEQTEDPRLRVMATLPALLFELSRAYKGREAAGGEMPLPYRIVRYVEAHVTEDLSLDAIASRFYISKAQLCRLFKAASGSTVWEYVTVKRLLRAREAIRFGTPPAVAAGQAGWNDYSAFYRAYKKVFGAAPRAKETAVRRIEL